MKKFELPKLWYVEGNTERKDAKDAWNKLNNNLGQSANYAFFENCFYYIDEYGKKAYAKKDPPSGYTEINCDEFLKYAICEVPIKPYVQSSEYNELLIKLLNNE